ncbi:MAG: response regulator transcription factor [Chloroflexota bacterium]
MALTRILIAQGEGESLGPAVNALSGIGCEVITVTPETSLQQVLERRPDLVLVDLGDNEPGSLRLCEALHVQTHVPLIAIGCDDRWLVPSLSSGADDYLSKPLDMPTLVAKVMALLRRAGYTAEATRVIRVRDLTVDLDRCQVTLGSQPLALTPIEYRILAALARRAGRVLSCAELLKETQGYEVDEQEARDIIKVHIYHLRRKLEVGDTRGDYVVTVPGFGYMLERRLSSRPDSPDGNWTRRGVLRPASALEVE